MRGAKGDTLCVVAGRAGNHASGFLLVAELGNLVISSTKLERAGELEILGFDIHLGAVAEFRSRNDRSEPGHIFQNSGGIEYFLDIEHGSDGFWV